MLLLDTEDLPRQERAEAYQSLVSQNSSSSVATFEDSSTFRARMHLFELGPGRVFNVEASGNTLRRTPRMARQVDDPVIALALPTRSRNRMTWDGGHRLLDPGDLLLVDLAASYEYGWNGVGDSYAFQVDLDQLAVSMDDVRRAAPRLPESPLYLLVRDHIARVTGQAPELAGDVGAAELGRATVELMRALILSAGGGDRAQSEAQHGALAAGIQRYVTANVRDPDLSPRQIAAANGISLRTLYSVFDELGTSLEQSIIGQRLDGARRRLADPGAASLTIAAIAAEWGFTNQSHFSKRFRQAFGTTPREWRDEATGRR